jgi:hypothetical protein
VIAVLTDGVGNKGLSELTKIPVSTIENFKTKIKNEDLTPPRKYPDFFDNWKLGGDGLWYKK